MIKLVYIDSNRCIAQKFIYTRKEAMVAMILSESKLVSVSVYSDLGKSLYACVVDFLTLTGTLTLTNLLKGIIIGGIGLTSSVS